MLTHGVVLGGDAVLIGSTHPFRMGTYALTGGQVRYSKLEVRKEPGTSKGIAHRTQNSAVGSVMALQISSPIARLSDISTFAGGKYIVE